MRIRNRKTTHEMVIFAMLGALMFIGKLIMEGLPNIHPVAMFIMVFTVVYRVKALIPIGIFVVLTGVYGGFNLWWFPYLYIWAILWGMTMLIPKGIPKKIGAIVYPVVCGLYGLLYGILYAPAQAILFGYDLEKTLLWISTGLPYDILHGAGNLAMGLLVLPLSEVLKKLERNTSSKT